MALANGIVLALGSLLIGLPIILHLLMQPRPKLLTFPALRFVRQKQQSNRRQMQLRHWLLLLLRCLVIAAIVLALTGISSASAAFASWSIVGVCLFVGFLAALLLVGTFLWTKPLNKILVVAFSILLAISLVAATALGIRTARNPTQQIIGNRIAPVSTVMIVDTSPRMQYVFENQTRIEKAREMTRWLIEQLPLDSQVGIAVPDGSEPFFSVDISAATKRLETLSTDFRADPLARTLPPAFKLLSESLNERREIYIISDLSIRSWQETAGIKSLVEQYPDVSIYLIDVGAESPSNATVGPIKFSSEIVSQSSELEITSDIQVLGETKAGVATMYLEKPDLSRPVRADGKTLLPDQFIERKQIVEETGGKTISLRFTLEDRLQPGTHHGWVEFESGDGLDLDDRRYFTIQARPVWQVLVVAPRNVSTENLVEILSPYSFREAGTQEFDCTVMEQDQIFRLSEKDLTKYQAVFLVDPTPLNEGSWNLLANFAERGGGVGIYLGSNAAQNGVADESFNSPGARRLMPGELTRIYRAPKPTGAESGFQSDSTILSAVSTTHSITRPFNRSASSTLWNKLPIHQHWGMLPFQEQQTADFEVIFRFSNQVPAVVEKLVGRGRAIVMLTPISEPNRNDRWNDLFYDLEECYPAFRLVRGISEHLVSVSPNRLNLELGETALFNNELSMYPEEYRLFTPRDEEPLKIVADQEQIRYKFTDYPGQYRLKGTLDKVVLRGFSVNLEENATDLKRVEVAKFEQWFGKDRFQIGRNQEEIEREQGTMRVGREFYPILVTLLAVILGLEMLMSNRFYQQPHVAHSGGPARNE